MNSVIVVLSQRGRRKTLLLTSTLYESLWSVSKTRNIWSGKKLWWLGQAEKQHCEWNGGIIRNLFDDWQNQKLSQVSEPINHVGAIPTDNLPCNGKQLHFLIPRRRLRKMLQYRTSPFNFVVSHSLWCSSNCYSTAILFSKVFITKPHIHQTQVFTAGKKLIHKMLPS